MGGGGALCLNLLFFLHSFQGEIGKKKEEKTLEANYVSKSKPRTQTYTRRILWNPLFHSHNINMNFGW